MILHAIDKINFKRALNWFQGGLVVLLMLLSLGLSELYRAVWSDGGSNFWLNVAAVISAAFVVALVVSLIKDHAALKDVMHVWRVKQELNRIYRSSKKVQKALAANVPEALIIQYFQLHASKYVYLLEDNTLTISELNEQIEQFDARLAELGLTISTDDYQPNLLDLL